MLRRPHHEQPDSFAFTQANQAWAEAQITKFPEGRQASAIIPLLWRAQEQEGWLSRAAIEYVADMLALPRVRALEVATFYFMFHLHPVGSVAHVQICGTTPCMICGAENLVEMCRERIAPNPHEVSPDGKFSWEEVECLGACANAPMAQIGKDYYEDLTAERLGEILDELAAGRVPTPGPQTGRYASEPADGLTTLTAFDSGRGAGNASVELAMEMADTTKRIDGTEVPVITPWRDKGANHDPAPYVPPEPPAKPDAPLQAAPEAEDDAEAGTKPELLSTSREGGADDLKRIKGVGPKLEKLLHETGIFHFDQIAAWTPQEVAWADENLAGFKGRVSRDGWVEQAKALAEGGAPGDEKVGDDG